MLMAPDQTTLQGAAVAAQRRRAKPSLRLIWPAPAGAGGPAKRLQGVPGQDPARQRDVSMINTVELIAQLRLAMGGTHCRPRRAPLTAERRWRAPPDFPGTRALEPRTPSVVSSSEQSGPGRVRGRPRLRLGASAALLLGALPAFPEVLFRDSFEAPSGLLWRSTWGKAERSRGQGHRSIRASDLSSMSMCRMRSDGSGLKFVK